MPTGLHFPFRFDAGALHADLATAKSEPWPRHYNERDYGGDWSGIALRSAGGRVDQLVAAPPGAAVFEDTPLLARCPYFRELLSVFQCPLKAVRLLSLAPRSFIREHSDHALGYDDGEIRIHIPIRTNPDVEFYVAGERLLLEEGHCYFLNVNLPHRVSNRGTSERIHLVIDAEVNDWVHALFREGEREHWDVPRCPVSAGAEASTPVDDFRRRVLATPALSEQLRAIESRTQFRAKAIELGRCEGFDLGDGDIESALRGGPLKEAAPPGSGWIPVCVKFPGSPDGRPVAEWVHTGPRRFTEPFFENSVRAALRNPFARMFRIEAPLDAASQVTEDRNAPEPAGLIFHVSRCGSTLISRMLASSPRHVTISEAPPIDEAIQAVPRECRIGWLRQVVGALGRRKADDEEKLFIKLDAWHNRDFQLLREAFPIVPCIFVFRDPVEVMVSQLAKPGRLAIQSAAAGLSREAGCARALEEFFAPALAMRDDPRCLFVDYRELPGAYFGKIAGHFGLALSEEEQVHAREVTVRDAKNPCFDFRADAEEKQARASPLVRELCAQRLNGIYSELSIHAENSPAI